MRGSVPLSCMHFNYEAAVFMIRSIASIFTLKYTEEMRVYVHRRTRIPPSIRALSWLLCVPNGCYVTSDLSFVCKTIKEHSATSIMCDLASPQSMTALALLFIQIPGWLDCIKGSVLSCTLEAWHSSCSGLVLTLFFLLTVRILLCLLASHNVSKG